MAQSIDVMEHLRPHHPRGWLFTARRTTYLRRARPLCTDDGSWTTEEDDYDDDDRASSEWCVV